MTLLSWILHYDNFNWITFFLQNFLVFGAIAHLPPDIRENFLQGLRIEYVPVSLLVLSENFQPAMFIKGEERPFKIAKRLTAEKSQTIS